MKSFFILFDAHMKRYSLPFLIISIIAIVSFAGVVTGKTSIVDMAEEKVSLVPLYEKLGLEIKNQGHRGSCEIFAMLDVLEFHLAKRGQKINVSEQFAMWAANKASHKYESGAHGFDKQSGSDFYLAKLNYFLAGGIVIPPYIYVLIRLLGLLNLSFQSSKGRFLSIF